jgi:hypothetical protein
MKPDKRSEVVDVNCLMHVTAVKATQLAACDCPAFDVLPRTGVPNHNSGDEPDGIRHD